MTQKTKIGGNVEIDDYITLGIALAALIVGILSYRRSQKHDRVKLKINPAIYNDGITGFGISVTNLSFFDVTISEVGIRLGRKGDSLSLPGRIIPHLPVRLEPRSEEKFLFPHLSEEELVGNLSGENMKMSEVVADATHIFARTQCGYYIQVKSKPHYLMVKKK